MRLTRAVLLGGLLLGSLAPVLYAFEVGAYFDLGNLDFSRNRTSSDTDLPGDVYMWGLRLTGNDQLSDQLSLDLAYVNDTILRNLASALLTYTDEFFSIRLGPFFGIMNAPASILQSGLSTTVRLFVPGITVFTLRSDNTLSGRLVVPGDYIQEQSELSVGFYVPNAIPTVYVRNKRYTWKSVSGESVDSLTAYGLRTDIFQKNVPYRVVVDFAYQDVSRSFIEAATTTHSYGALVVGTEVSVELFGRVRVSAELESSIYAFGRDSLLGEVSADRFLFRKIGKRRRLK